jgi:threonine aldolase
MLQYMFNAEWEMMSMSKTNIIALETRTAALFGMEAGLFSVWNNGKSNAIKVNTQGEQLIADKYAHVYHYEGGGVSFNSGVLLFLDGKRGMINLRKWLVQSMILSFTTVR